MLTEVRGERQRERTYDQPTSYLDDVHAIDTISNQVDAGSHLVESHAKDGQQIAATLEHLHEVVESLCHDKEARVIVYCHSRCTFCAL